MGLGVKGLVLKSCFTATNLELWVNQLIFLDLSFLKVTGVLGEDSIETSANVHCYCYITNHPKFTAIKQQPFYCAYRFYGLEGQAGLNGAILLLPKTVTQATQRCSAGR